MSTFGNNLIERLRTRLIDVSLKTNWARTITILRPHGRKSMPRSRISGPGRLGPGNAADDSLLLHSGLDFEPVLRPASWRIPALFSLRHDSFSRRSEELCVKVS
jgi:hypothetical protein